MDNSSLLHGGKLLHGARELLRVKTTRFKIHWRTWISEEMMADTMARFQGCETIAAENIRELGEEFLDLRRSREEGSMAKSRLRSRRSMKNHRLQALSAHNHPSFDVDEEVKMFQEVCTEERNRHRS